MTMPLTHKVTATLVMLGSVGVGWWLSSPPSPVPTPEMMTAKAARPGVPGAGQPAPTEPPPRRAAWPEPSPEALRAWQGLEPAPAAAPLRPASPAPVATAAVAPAPPTAPPPAWRFIGRITDAGSVRAMLATPQHLRVVAEQEALDADWRVESIGEQAVELLWLPGAQRVRLPWAAS
jgi:hypothetical protein